MAAKSEFAPDISLSELTHDSNPAAQALQNQSVSSPEEPSSSDGGGKISGPKRALKRTVFSRRQLAELEARFVQQSFLSKEERRELAKTLSLSERQVMIWFQNRRGRLKKRGQGDVAYNPLKLEELNQRRPQPFLYGLLTGLQNQQQQNELRSYLSYPAISAAMNPEAKIPPAQEGHIVQAPLQNYLHHDQQGPSTMMQPAATQAYHHHQNSVVLQPHQPQLQQGHPQMQSVPQHQQMLQHGSHPLQHYNAYSAQQMQANYHAFSTGAPLLQPGDVISFHVPPHEYQMPASLYDQPQHTPDNSGIIPSTELTPPESRPSDGEVSTSPDSPWQPYRGQVYANQLHPGAGDVENVTSFDNWSSGQQYVPVL